MALLSKTIIMLGGKEVPVFKNVQLHQKIHAHHILEARFPWQIFEDSKSELGEKSKDYLGKRFSIQITTENKNGESFGELKFTGIVSGIKIIKDTHADSGDEIAIIVSSPEMIADDGPNYNCFHEMRLDAIIKKALKDYNLEINAASTMQDAIDYTVQHHESSYDFVKRLAEQYGQWFYYNGEKLVFGKPEENETKLSYHYDLKEFNLNLVPQPQKFTYFSNDYLQDKLQSEGQHKKPSGVAGKNATVFDKSNEIFKVDTNVWVNTNNDASTAKMLKSKSKAQQESFALNQVRITGSSVNSGVVLGNIISIDNIKYRVVEVNHSLSRMDHYENYFEAVKANIEGYPLTNINSFPVSQSQIAVVKDNNDPDKLGRVKVSFAWQELIGEMTPWIRVLSPHAGSSQGIQFIPEIGDQVLVDFEGGDAESPYVVGSLYHAGHTPDNAWSSEDNNTKIIRTRSGHTIELDDTDGEEKIKIYDNGGSIITFDTSKKSLTLKAIETFRVEASKIELVSKENIDIEAKGNITQSAEGDLTVLSKGELNLQADGDCGLLSKGNVAIEAINEATVKAVNTVISGKASAEVSSVQTKVSGSAVTEVSGAIVKIN